MSKLTNLDSKDDRTGLSLSIHTPLLPCDTNKQHEDSVNSESNESKLSIIYVYSLYFFIFLFILLSPYLLFTQIYLKKEAIAAKMHRQIFQYSLLSKCVIQEVQKTFDGTHGEGRKVLAKLLFIFAILHNIMVVETCVQELRSTHWRTLLSWIAFVPISYVATHLVHRCIAALVIFVVTRFSSVSEISARMIFIRSILFIARCLTQSISFLSIIRFFYPLMKIFKNFVI